MVFEKHVCWKPENFRKIVHTEAEASPDNVFLSVHTDNQLTLKKIDGTTHKITYKEFLQEFLSDTYGNNVSSVIEGESGAGKSHLVQWLRLHIPETENRYVLTIPKSQTNLYSVLKMLIEMLPQDKHNEFTSKLEQRDTELTNDGQRVHVLLNSLATSIITDQAKNEEEEYLIPLLPKIFTDPYFRDTFFPNNSLVKKLISLIFLDSSTNRNLEDRQEFTYEDLPLNAAQATHAAMPTQEILDAMNDEELLEVSLEIINRNLDKAISKSLNFTPNDLIELMYEIRKYLGTQNKELVLLIEDFAQLQGLDTSLLQTLTVEGNQNLCQIRWAMAVTTGYYEKLEDTLRTRMVLKVNMDNLWDSRSQEKQENYIINLSSKYLNAIRLGLNDIENWFENYDINTSSPKITNKCDECAFKIVCHESFGEVDGIGLYPFNSISLIQMARKADVERFNTFRPRIFLNKVLHRNLNHKSVDLLQNGAFPDQDLLKDFSIQRLSTDELHKLETIDSLDYLRRRTLLEIWSNSSIVVNLNEGIHKAFNIKQLTDLNEIPTLSHLSIQKQESSLVQETIKPTNKLLEALENWGKGHDLRDGEKNQIASLIYNVLDSNIQWDFLPVAKSFIKFKAGQIYFENQQTRRPTTGIVLDIKCSTENAIVLKTLYLSNQDSKIPESIELFTMLQNKIESWKKYIENEVIRYFSPKVNWDPFEATLELVILECLMSNNDFQTKDFLSPTQMPQMFSNEFNSLVKSVYGNNFKERILLDILKRTYTGRKGGGITESFFNLYQIQRTIKKLKKNNFLLKQDPMQEDRTDFNDIKNRYQIWKDNFENALTEEILLRVKLLEKIHDKVSIDEIGQTFRNKVENLISLLQTSGIRSYTSNNLNLLLKCNLKQAKESFLSINKLTSLEEENALVELFPSRKNDTLEFIKLIEEIDIFLNRVEDNTKQMFIEHKQASNVSGVIDEIDIQINSIENSLTQIIGDK